MKLYTILVVILTSYQIGQVKTSLSDYVKTVKSYFVYEEPEETDLSGEFTRRIPYEVSTVDEKFISEAAKLTGVTLSELDSCQQRVVLKLKSDCDKMNDEQLAKMAVHLLNCQSYVEGRRIFTCTEDMSIGDCTSSMDSDTWTSYHLMSNRARAVCYSIRQMQFRGLAEHTVNRLMDVSRDQLKTLTTISENQHELKSMAESTLDSLLQGHRVLSNQQKNIQKAQFHGQLVLEDNIKRLSEEKDLIINTHNQLVTMTHRIQQKLEDSARSLEKQAGQSKENHQELLDDLVAVQMKAEAIFQRIEESSELLLEQNENLRSQYQETLKNLVEMNKTVHNLVSLVGGTRQALEDRLIWLTTTLGGTDLAIERLYLVIWHSAFILVSMLTCAFLSARLSTRTVVAILPPLNLILALWRNDNQLSPLGLSSVILSFVVGQFVLLWGLKLKPRVQKAIAWTNSPTIRKKEDSPIKNTILSTTEREQTPDLRSDELDDFNINNFLGSPTPPLSRSGFYNRSRSRSTTPLILNGGGRSACHAKTRLGTPCKLSSLPGRDYCYKHQAGDSVIA